MTVTVYSKPACPQCSATRRALDKAQVAYEEIDLTQDPDALAAVIALGHQQAPVVMAGADHWSGFQPDRIAALAALVDTGALDAADAARLRSARQAARSTTLNTAPTMTCWPPSVNASAGGISRGVGL
jgi:glutaredoxin-like protein NrdH